MAIEPNINFKCYSLKPDAPDTKPTSKPAPNPRMTSIDPKPSEKMPPKTDISGIIRSVSDLVEAAFKKGVKQGRYLEQMNRKPTPRGTWEDCDVFGFSGVSVYRCSVCKNTRWGGKTNYCQFCGANMMEEKKE